LLAVAAAVFWRFFCFFAAGTSSVLFHSPNPVPPPKSTHPLAARLALWVRTHPRRIVAALAAVLLTGTGAAVAVVRLGPDPADLPASLHSAPVASLAAGYTLAELSSAQQLYHLRLYRTEALRSSDTPETLLQRLGVADPAAAAWLRKNADVHQHLLGRSGRVVTAEATPDHMLLRLSARWIPGDDGSFRRLVVERDADGAWQSRLETGQLVAQPRLAGGIIQSSLFAATDAQNLADNVAIQIAEIFQTEVDFRRDLRKGDRFSVIYEALLADGQMLRSGRVLAAEFHNKGRRFEALWYQDGDADRGGYYTLDGKSRRTTYLASPLEFSRISSGFTLRRFHPIKKEWRAHRGTDFAAATGTQVRTVGDGTVSFAGEQGGYGKVVFVEHANKHTTVYAHLSQIAVKKGQKVAQGETVGKVGQTGWATGPHLHFEFRVNGQHRDPMTIVRDPAITAAARALPEAQRARFTPLAEAMRRDLAASTQALDWQAVAMQ